MIKGTYSFRLFAVTVLFLGLSTVTINTANAQTSDDSETSLPVFDIGGFLQQQFIIDQTSGSPARFSTHRARLGVTGKITDNISVNLIGGYTEPPNNTPRLVNAFIDFDIHPLLQVRTGQFLLPFGLEGPEPIVLNPAIERSTAIRQINTFSMFRDVGVQLSGSRENLNYAVAVVNGTGANRPEQIDPKDVMGRVGLSITDDIEIGLSGHYGHYQTDPSTNSSEARYRAGADLHYEGDPVFMRAEYIVRQDDLPEGDNLNLNGGYLLGGYHLNDNVEAIARIEYLEPNTDLDEDHYTSLTAGLNYVFTGNNRLSLNYEFRNDRFNPTTGNLLTLQMQVAL